MATRIMVVEDDDLIRQLLRYQLGGAGYEVVCVKSGLQALQRLLLDQPDLLLLDVMMPELSGWETCRQVRACSNVPIIMLTAKGADDDVVAGLTLGADDYVTKPFSLPLLLARVEAVLRRRNVVERAAGHTPPRSRNGESAVRREPITDPHLRYASEVYANRRPQGAVVEEPTPTPAAPPRALPAPGAAPAVGQEPAAAERLGQRLHDLRVARGATLEQAAQGCGVRWEFLQALEREHWTYIPRPELRRALRSYCGYLGLDMEAALGPRPPHPIVRLARGEVPLPVLLLLVLAITLVAIGLALL